MFIWHTLELILELMTLFILLRALMTWITPGQTNIVTKVLYEITEPVLAPLRRIIPRRGVVDYTPLAAALALQVIIMFLPK